MSLPKTPADVRRRASGVKQSRTCQQFGVGAFPLSERIEKLFKLV
jgi:hypothetical protein